jgi:hypothetical protein
MVNFPGLPPNSTNKVMAIILPIIVALGIGIGAGAVETLQHLQQSPITARKQMAQQPFTLAQYNRLTIGMSRSEVELMLQPGTEESRSGGDAKFKWVNPDGSYIRVVFEHDKITNKEQSELPIHPVCPQ